MLLFPIRACLVAIASACLLAALCSLRDFRGAMAGWADKGIILTTGAFTVDAKKAAVRDGVPPIELVDGEKLVSMLEELEIGFIPMKAFRVDEPFFLSFGKVVGEADDSGGSPGSSSPE